MLVQPLMIIYFKVILLDPSGNFKVANANMKVPSQPTKSVWGLVEYVRLNSRLYLQHPAGTVLCAHRFNNANVLLWLLLILLMLMLS